MNLLVLRNFAGTKHFERCREENAERNDLEKFNYMYLKHKPETGVSFYYKTLFTVIQFTVNSLIS